MLSSRHVVSDGCWRLIQDGPDEATEFSGDGGNGNVAVFALIQMPELFVEPVLGFQGNGNDRRRLSLTSSVQDEISPCTMAIVPGGFDQETPDMNVASFGNGATVFFIAGRVLRRNESEVSHQRTRRPEASDVIDFTDEGESSQALDATEAAKSFGLGSELMRTGKAFELGIDGTLLSFKILQMFEFESQRSLERAMERLTECSKPRTVLFGPSGLALFEHIAMVTQDA
jgi:hypothetical protein